MRTLGSLRLLGDRDGLSPEINLCHLPYAWLRSVHTYAVSIEDPSFSCLLKFYLTKPASCFLQTHHPSKPGRVSSSGFLLLWKQPQQLLGKKTFNWVGSLTVQSIFIMAVSKPSMVLKKKLRVLTSWLTSNRKWSEMLGVAWAYMRPQSPPPQWHTSSNKPIPISTKPHSY